MSRGRLLRLICQQIAGVFGAITLMVMLGDLVQLGWRGVFAKVVAVWEATVRPVVAWLLDIIVAQPLLWLFGWRVEFPLWLQDYLCVGLVFAVSAVREIAVRQPLDQGLVDQKLTDRLPRLVRWTLLPLFGFVTIVLVGMVMALIWPIVIVGALALVFSGDRDEKVSNILVLSPFGYLLVIVAANYLLY